MDNVNKTMYIPLYGKAYVSEKGILLKDPKAEEIWAAESFTLKGKSKSKWLAYYMAMRARVFDQWLQDQMKADPSAVVLHLGCGLDSRVLRVSTSAKGHWYDVDFPEVISERKRYFQEDDHYHMLSSDVRNTQWLQRIPADSHVIIVMEGISMYLPLEELKTLLGSLQGYFSKASILMDCYTTFAAKASKYKNPINDVGVTQVYGLDDPTELADGTGLKYVREHEMTPEAMVNQLSGMERTIFSKVYGGSMAHKMYRMYEYETK